MSKLQLGILGATGAAGFEFVRALANHSWFEIAELYANQSSGRKLEEATKFDISNLPTPIRNLTVQHSDSIRRDLDLICSALPSEEARKLEAECARHTPVISTASAFRYEQDVPIIIPEVNAAHYPLLALQRQRDWNGWIAPGPNCTTVALVMALAPIYQALGLESVNMTSLQSVSGAGATPLNIFREQRTLNIPYPLEDSIAPIINPELWFDGNVIPYIEGEERKVTKETRKILGTYNGNGISEAQILVDPTCTRVPVAIGHLEIIKVITTKTCSLQEVLTLYEQFNELSRERFGSLPSSPRQTIYTLERAPQPMYDVNLDGGMATIIGRIEKYSAHQNGIKFIALSNNLEKGAAKGMVQVAEYLYTQDFLRPK